MRRTKKVVEPKERLCECGQVDLNFFPPWCTEVEDRFLWFRAIHTEVKCEIRPASVRKWASLD